MAAVAMFDEVQTPTLALAARAFEDALFGLDPRLLSGEDAAKGVEVLARTVKICQAKKAQLAARAADCGEHEKRGFSRPSDWLARKSGSTTGEARRDLELAAKLEDHPQTKDALDNGEVSVEEADEAIKTDEECPGSENDILNEAKRKGLGAAKHKGRRLRQRAKDIDELERKRWKARSVRTWTDELGMLNVLATLLPEDGQRFLARLEAETERQWRAGNRDSTIEQRMHDAFMKMLEGKGKGPARRPEAVVVINADEGSAHLPAMGPITLRSALEMARDALITAVLHDGKKITDYKRFGPHIPTELRTLLELGEPPDFDGCICVDCEVRFAPEIDHVDPRANGGVTTFENLVTRCPPCHKAKTERDREAGLLGQRAKEQPKKKREGRGPP